MECYWRWCREEPSPHRFRPGDRPVHHRRQWTGKHVRQKDGTIRCLYESREHRWWRRAQEGEPACEQCRRSVRETITEEQWVAYQRFRGRNPSYAGGVQQWFNPALPRIERPYRVGLRHRWEGPPRGWVCEYETPGPVLRRIRREAEQEGRVSLEAVAIAWENWCARHPDYCGDCGRPWGRVSTV